MKSTVRLVLLLVCVCMFFAMGCSDDKDDNNKVVNPGGSSTTKNTFAANVTGKYTLNYSTNAVVATKDLVTNSVTINGAMTASGITYNMMITININKGTGNFPLLAPDAVTTENDGWAVFTATATNNDVDMYHSISGSVTLTEASPRLKGTFQFTAENFESEQVSVSNGSFNTSFSTTR
ncbi:hypothetical protein JW935_00115 [candidate division KSB1 bacterium]|nr:hypothetical protein [candidate division KSB1 bacterium]